MSESILTPAEVAAQAVEATTVMTGDPMRWTGRAILDGTRTWVEIAPGEGASDDWSITWFADDGHGASTPADVFAGEAAWLI